MVKLYTVFGTLFGRHDNVRPHASPQTDRELKHCYWENFGHPPHSPDLLQGTQYFPKLKEFLGGKQLFNDEEPKQAVTTLLKNFSGRREHGHRNTGPLL